VTDTRDGVTPRHLTTLQSSVKRNPRIHSVSLVQGLTDLITETEDGVSPMTYIRSLYPRDWEHFLERMGPRLNGIDAHAVSEEDFCEGGALAHLQMELQLWAAYRGQLLARTVRGADFLWQMRCRFRPREGCWHRMAGPGDGAG